MLVLKDFSTSILAAPLSDTATSVVVGDAGRFPSLSAGSYFYAVLQKFSDRHQVEIVKVIGVSGNTFTLERAQAGTVAKQFTAGDYIELRLTVATFDEYIRQCVAGKVDSVDGVVRQGLLFENAGDSVRGFFGIEYDGVSHGVVVGGGVGGNAVGQFISFRPLGKDDSSVEAVYSKDGAFSLIGGSREFNAGVITSLHGSAGLGWPSNTPNDEHNYINDAKQRIVVGNNGLFFVADDGPDARRFGIQAGHESPAFPTLYGVLELNPYGGAVKVNGGTVYHTNYVPTPAAVGALPVGGTAVAATKLATPRAINGTNFDGSAAITTALWGTARTLTIGNSGKSVNGSGNVSWSLAEIGAQASDATLTALAGLATGANQLPYSTGTDTFAQTPLTAFARTLLDDADAATARGTLGAAPDGYGLGAPASQGGFGSWVLPQFLFGEGSVTDEYLVLFPSAAVGPHGIKGEIRTSRGSYASGNVPTVERINAQSAYNSNQLYLGVENLGRFPYFSLLNIGGVQYVALKGEATGGHAHNQLAFYGDVIGGDSKLFTKVRASDSNVTVVTEILASRNLIYNSGNILGTVAQSGGIPTGAIIEHGSNANGDYVKFADGTMICRAIRTCPSGWCTFNYAATFAVTPIVLLSAISSGPAYACIGSASQATYLSVVYNSAGAPVTSDIFTVAIGRWF